jgi:saccharopine dehydrogenase-like NADP-dependent oxidoreductase
MARTTGYTCTAGVRLVAAGLFREPGVIPPERIGGHEGCLDFMLARLAERRVVFERTVRSIDGVGKGGTSR